MEEKKIDIYIGASRLSNDNILIELWTLIHENGNYWFDAEKRYPEKIDIKIRSSQLSRFFTHLWDLPASIWHSLCTAAGMTVYGAVALSWCKDAKIEQVWEGWEQSGFPLLPRPEYERPARFINKELLPQSNSLKDITQAADNKSLPIAAMIVALEDETLEFDLPEAQLKGASPQVAAFLKKKAEAQGGASPELIAHWEKTIEGTDYA